MRGGLHKGGENGQERLELWEVSYRDLPKIRWLSQKRQLITFSEGLFGKINQNWWGTQGLAAAKNCYHPIIKLETEWEGDGGAYWNMGKAIAVAFSWECSL
jgi:hypothetical protein